MGCPVPAYFRLMNNRIVRQIKHIVKHVEKHFRLFQFWCPVPVQVRTNTQTYCETYRVCFTLKGEGWRANGAIRCAAFITGIGSSIQLRRILTATWLPGMKESLRRRHCHNDCAQAAQCARRPTVAATLYGGEKVVMMADGLVGVSGLSKRGPGTRGAPHLINFQFFPNKQTNKIISPPLQYRYGYRYRNFSLNFSPSLW